MKISNFSTNFYFCHFAFHILGPEIKVTFGYFVKFSVSRITKEPAPN